MHDKRRYLKDVLNLHVYARKDLAGLQLGSRKTKDQNKYLSLECNSLRGKERLTAVQ